MADVAFWLAPDWGEPDMAHWPPYAEPFWMREPAEKKTRNVGSSSLRPVTPSKTSAIFWICNQVLQSPRIADLFPDQRIVHVEYFGATASSFFFEISLDRSTVSQRIAVATPDIKCYQGYNSSYEQLLLSLPYVGDNA